MGYNNNHAGIHPVPGNYKWKTDMISSLDKYASLLAENNLKKVRENNQKKQRSIEVTGSQSSIPGDVIVPSDDEIIEWVKGAQDITLWDTYREEEYCSCGCHKRLQHKNKLDVEIRQDGTSLSIIVPGRFCLQCKRRYVVKRDLIKTIRKVCGW